MSGRSLFLLVSSLLWACGGDNIMDFELPNQRPGSIGVLRGDWTRASQPADGEHDHRNMVDNFIWFNPLQMVRATLVYPEIEQAQLLIHVLNLDIFSGLETSMSQTNRWMGVMRTLEGEISNMSSVRYIEIMVQGETGMLHIDVGAISEDVIPNGKLDTEDRRVNGFRNGILDEGEDTGLDGVSRLDPPEVNYPRTNHLGGTIDQVPFDFWDVNNNGIKDEDEPWSYDDWYYPELSSQYITPGTGSIDGGESNMKDESGNRPDTEDLNLNGRLDIMDQYLSFSFSLHNDSPDTSLIVGGNPDPAMPGGPWKLYRIPFDLEHTDLILGDPQFEFMEYVRIWVDSLDYNLRFNNTALPNFARVSIAELTFVSE